MAGEQSSHQRVKALAIRSTAGNVSPRWRRTIRTIHLGDAQDIANAHAMFARQQPEMWQWLKDQKNIYLDRHRGNSYSIRIK